MLDIFKFVTGYPSHSTQIRLQRIHEVLAAACNRKDSSESEIERYLPDLSVSQPLSVNPEDLYSPIKPRSDSLLGQTAQQIRKRARETVIQGNKTEYFSTISTNEHSHRAVKPISATPPVTCAHEAQSSANSFPFRGGNSLEMVAEDDESDCTCDSILESSQISSCITNFNSNKDLIKTVVRHNINSESKQVMGYDTIAYETDADLTLGKGIEDNVKAIEGALRRFTELDRMFSTATVELEQRVFIKTAQTEVKDRKGAVIRILIAEFIESLPWKVINICY